MLFPESRKGLESSPLLSRDSGPIGPWKEKSQGTMTNPRAPRFCPGGTPAGTHHSAPPSEMSLSPILCPTFAGHTRPGTRSPKGVHSPEGDRLPRRGRTAILYSTEGEHGGWAPSMARCWPSSWLPCGCAWAEPPAGQPDHPPSSLATYTDAAAGPASFWTVPTPPLNPGGARTPLDVDLGVWVSPAREDTPGCPSPTRLSLELSKLNG